MPTSRARLKSLVIKIAHCEVAEAVLNIPLRELNEEQLQCAAIVGAQLGAAIRYEPEAVGALPWLVPEPWNGHLATARILFVGQNPSANHGELYPVERDDAVSLNEAQLFAYFDGRFDEGTPGGIVNGTEVQMTDPAQARTANRFLTQVKTLAAQLLGPDPIPGVDYALTEAVRCKAAYAIGVDLAMQTCARRYLERTLELSGATTIVCLGGLARDAFCLVTGSEFDPEKQTCEWEGRKVAFVLHPSAHVVAARKLLTDAQLDFLKG